MCEKCNEAMLAAANTSLVLSQAAKNLYSINATKEADTLAKAAAELFTEVKPEASTTTPGNASLGASKDSAEGPQKHPIESLLDALLVGGDQKPQAFRIEDGIAYINDQPFGRIVVMGGPKPTKH